jgi:hypothetical protein
MTGAMQEIRARLLSRLRSKQMARRTASESSAIRRRVCPLIVKVYAFTGVLSMQRIIAASRVRSCRVTIQDMDGVSHTVEVTAAPLYEAVGISVSSRRH